MANVTGLPGFQSCSADFLGVIEESLDVRCHYDLLSWLQGSVQALLPHDILLAAWGNPSLGLLHIDVTSRLEDMRTQALIEAGITPFVHELLQKWEADEYAPRHLSASNGFGVESPLVGFSRPRSLRRMRTALVHGIRNQRDKQVCLYAIFSSQVLPPFLARNMEVLLPHIDAAIRRIEHLPMQRAEASAMPRKTIPEEFDLSDREADIVVWVAAGKTNQEIGLIMEISPFTVKNHLRRIFQKLNVSNRAQAVHKLSLRSLGGDSQKPVHPVRSTVSRPNESGYAAQRRAE